MLSVVAAVRTVDVQKLKLVRDFDVSELQHMFAAKATHI